MTTVKEGALLWEPSQKLKSEANISRYMQWLKDEKGLRFDSYHQLWKWSVTDIEGFWASLWDFFAIRASRPYTRILSGRNMPGADWFPGSQLNYAQHVFRNMSPDRPALIFQSELRPMEEISWDALYRKVSSVAAALRKMGVKRGDRVVALMPNIPETLIAFLACACIGATWSSCSPDFGTRSVKNRFQQIEPKVLFAVNGYCYGGKSFDCLPKVAELQKSLSTIRKTVLVSYLETGSKPDGLQNLSMWEVLLEETGEMVFEQVPFNHPLWVLYSSGTTGLPKGLVHGHGGILLEHQKFLGLQMDLKPDDRFFWFSTTGWVMWNILQGGLLLGATILMYDGNPGHPDMDVLWRFAEKTGMTVFGTSAAYLTACMNVGLKPGKDHDLGRLKTVGSTGSPLPLDAFRWAYESIKKDLWLASVSGGTDPATGFLGSCPLLPVHAGELQCRCLGVKAEAFDEQGNSLTDQVGELVISEPMPSMPLYLWNDPKKERYMESYFEMYPGVWRHGDWVKITRRESAVILGRSDSTLNRLGVRIGSSEIYGLVEEMPEVATSLVVGFEAPDGNYRMPLFVVLREGLELDDDLKARINRKIRSALSPRHVPDDIFAIPEVPTTLNGKKLEVPVKKILMGVPTEKAVNVDSMSNPRAIEYFVELSKKFGFQKDT